MRASLQLALISLFLGACESARMPAEDAGTSADTGTRNADTGLDGGLDGGSRLDSSSAIDAGIADAGDAIIPDAGFADGGCQVQPDQITCGHNTSYVPAGGSRRLFWQVPLGEAPTDGWPVVLLFHGSFVRPEASWTARRNDAFGFYWQTRTIWKLMEAGYAVITPEAEVGPTRAWNTNIPPWSTLWESSPDHKLMLDIFAAIGQGEFGPLNDQRMYATGLSSGGYMTSRMAIAYPGRFKALAIQSASYATCAGSTCDVPELPADHPPTLLLHGQGDPIVPISTAQTYYDALESQGTAVDLIVDEQAGHEWIEAAPESILQWFESHN